jgi:hypothetical protein
MLADGNNLVACVKRPKPRRYLPVHQSRRIELRVADLEYRNAHDIAQLERGIGGDVHAIDLERPVEPDPPEGPMRLLAEVAPGALVERHGHGRRTMRAQPDERETAPEIPAEHG